MNGLDFDATATDVLYAREPDFLLETETSPASYWQPEKSRHFPLKPQLWSFDVACRAVIQHALQGDATQVLGFGVQFVDTLVPGNTLITKVWNCDGKLRFLCYAKADSKSLLISAFMKVNRAT